MAYCEKLVEDAATEGKDSFPPSYAKFIGYCRAGKITNESKAPAHRVLESVFERLPEPKGAREERRKLGIRRCGDIMDMLGE